MNQDMSILNLVLHASTVVQVVMLLLLLVSVASWSVIFSKVSGLKRVRLDNDEFDREFWAGRTLQELYQDATQGQVGPRSPQERIFAAGMHAFTGLSNVQQVSLATVAPGIAEALVATAIGLFAAIPAVLAYNRFARDIDRVAIQMESFIEEFSNILARNAAPVTPGAAEASRSTMGR